VGGRESDEENGGLAEGFNRWVGGSQNTGWDSLGGAKKIRGQWFFDPYADKGSRGVFRKRGERVQEPLVGNSRGGELQADLWALERTNHRRESGKE